ncbi:PAS domain-containing sensor histidine kinase [Hymenobacter sp. BT507]|uniref:histidine kinase n=1 Tax=Hymenobacter citatus TaxID=2763506 RepID=A0ABR7MEU3_9BACT|nr:PAS domain-containing sensor histidine kinase [Hymenobacter citatus]MBC6609589.1 PAS domain-containing sensor histidine kinase [Hymenobacter citatus]
MREQHLHALLHHLPAGVATLQGPDLRYGYLNKAMQELLGTDVAEGQCVADHPGVLPSDLVDVLQQVYHTGIPYVAKACSLPLPPQDGKESVSRCYDLVLEPVRDDAQEITGLVLFAVDVTQQEEARQRAHTLAMETRRLDARLRVLTETVPQITFSLDAEGLYEYVSPQWYYFTGQPPTADLNAIWPLLIHPDDRLRVLYQGDAARKAGTGWSYEYRLRRHDGQYRWMLSRALPELHAPDRPVFWHGALTEVHDQRELSDALRRGEAELRFLADSIPELIWTATAEGFIDYYNHYTGEYSGLTKEELGPTGWVNLLEPRKQAEAARQWVKSVAMGEPFEGLFRMRRHDGQYRWHIIRARQLADERGPRWFGACTDVDDQHRLREVLQVQYDELARTNRDLDTFVYTASHDLKQPLFNLRGLFEELRRSATFDDPEEEQLLSMVDDSLRQLDSTLQELAATVQDQRGLSAPVEQLDLRHIADEVLLGLRAQIQASDATVQVEVADAPTLLYGRANLRSILHNLLSNALKFAHPERPPVITLRSYLSANKQPVLMVQDNGLGLTIPKTPTTAFQPFVRQHPQVGGSGVGLYLVQRILASRGGHLEVSSSIGEGTTFTLHWFEEA